MRLDCYQVTGFGKAFHFSWRLSFESKTITRMLEPNYQQAKVRLEYWMLFRVLIELFCCPNLYYFKLQVYFALSINCSNALFLVSSLILTLKELYLITLN